MSDLVRSIASMIDHAILKPELTRAEVERELDLVADYEVFSACVRPCDVAHAVDRLAGSSVAVGTVLGFPHGSASTKAKVTEAATALADGAAELDMVLNIGWLRSGMVGEVEADIKAVVDVCGEHVVKVILETAYLDDHQIVQACRATENAGADFVKTSTGFAGAGATVEHVRLMRASVSDGVQVKASGGVRHLDDLLTLQQAGATRFGTSGSAGILDAARAREAGLAEPGATGDASY